MADNWKKLETVINCRRCMDTGKWGVIPAPPALTSSEFKAWRERIPAWIPHRHFSEQGEWKISVGIYSCPKCGTGELIGDS